jgi:hypothetical protein
MDQTIIGHLSAAAPLLDGATAKSVLKSKTMWGIILMVIPVVSKALGHEIAPADAAGLVNASQALIDNGLTFGGLVMAVWGRATAAKPLKFF